MDIGVAPPSLAPLTLESRYTELDRPVLLSGTQALVRVLLEQARLDKQAGLNTGGLVSVTVVPRWAASTRSFGGARRG